MSPPTTLIASRYRILRELGRGGMGVVYLVEHVHTGDHLALKLLLTQTHATPEIIERFKREARAPARIKSEHVVRVTDADVAPELGGAPFLVMELLDGEDLEKLVQRDGALPPATVVRMLSQASIALEKAHAIGITHRDLKPENIYLHRRENGETIIKLLDFGISKLTGDGNEIAQAGLTKTGAMMGTPLYMSPEQALGRTTLGPPTDLWALGLIAYRLLTGDVYWKADTLAHLMVRIISEPMPPPTQIAPVVLPAAFDAWFARSCARDPAERWPGARAQVEALAWALGVPLDARTSSPSSPSSPSLPPRVPSTPDIASRPSLGGTTAAGAVAQGVVATGAPKRGSTTVILLAGALLMVGVGGTAAVVSGVFNRSAASPELTPTSGAPSQEATSTPPKKLIAVEKTNEVVGSSTPSPPESTSVSSTAPAAEPSVKTKKVPVATGVLAKGGGAPSHVVPSAVPPPPASTSAGKFNPSAP